MPGILRSGIYAAAVHCPEKKQWRCIIFGYFCRETWRARFAFLLIGGSGDAVPFFVIKKLHYFFAQLCIMYRYAARHAQLLKFQL